MRYIIQSPHLTVNTVVRQTVQGKFKRCEKLFDRIDTCKIVLKNQKNDKSENFIVEAKLAIQGNDLFASERANSFEVAAEMVGLNLESQIRRHKAKANWKSKTRDYKLTNEEEAE